MSGVVTARDLVVLAIGGNSLIRDEQHKTLPDQWQLARETCQHIAGIVANGHRVVITHGNGPQVGFVLRRSELSSHELHEVPLDICIADTQGAIGYMIQQSLADELARRGIPRGTVSLVTRVEVDPAAPELARPSKPIGSFMDEATARARSTKGGWPIAEDSGRGWRRVVGSPPPLCILELEAIRRLLGGGMVVVAVGGGGIPVARDADGNLRGVDAVIDKDLASSLLARDLEADQLVISTAVPKVCLDFGKPIQRALDHLTVAAARHYLAAGQFGRGSMGPKIDAAIRYVEHGGRRAVITCPAELEDAVEGRAGTVIEG